MINSNERNGTFNEIEELLAQIFPQKLELLSDWGFDLWFSSFQFIYVSEIFK